MNKYKHGDVIQIKPSTENGEFKVASVVAITIVKTDDESKHFSAPIGTVFYTVEFPDGSDAFVQENELQPKTNK